MGRRPAGAAALTLVGAATPLHPEPALFDAMLEGWCRQHSARRLCPAIAQRVRVVRRFAESHKAGPGSGGPSISTSWVAQGRWTHSTIRSYEATIALFMAYLCDPRYGWAERVPSNGWARSRPRSATSTTPPSTSSSTRAAPSAGPSAGESCRHFSTPPTRRWPKLPALRRRDGSRPSGTPRSSRSSMPGVCVDVRRRCSISRTSGQSGCPRARALRHAARALRQGHAGQPAPPARRGLGHALGGRGARASTWTMSALSMASRRDEPGPVAHRAGRADLAPAHRRALRPMAGSRRAPSELSVHCLRHTYTSHLVEDGVDPLFVQHQLGHSLPSTTAVYTSVGADHTNRMLREVLDRAFGKRSAHEPGPSSPKGLLPLAPADE